MSASVRRELPGVLDSLIAKKGGERRVPPAPGAGGTGGTAFAPLLCRCRLGVVGEVEVGEVGLCPVGGEFDGGLVRLVEHERVAVKSGEAGGEHGSEELPD